jgi:hypothetical protein
VKGKGGITERIEKQKVTKRSSIDRQEEDTQQINKDQKKIKQQPEDKVTRHINNL